MLDGVVVEQPGHYRAGWSNSLIFLFGVLAEKTRLLGGNSGVLFGGRVTKIGSTQRKREHRRASDGVG